MKKVRGPLVLSHLGKKSIHEWIRYDYLTASKKTKKQKKKTEKTDEPLLRSCIANVNVKKHNCAFACEPEDEEK